MTQLIFEKVHPPLTVGSIFGRLWMATSHHNKNKNNVFIYFLHSGFQQLHGYIIQYIYHLNYIHINNSLSYLSFKTCLNLCLIYVMGKRYCWVYSLTKMTQSIILRNSELFVYVWKLIHWSIIRAKEINSQDGLKNQ